MRIRVTRSGRKHKIGKAHILATIASVENPISIGDRLIYVGVDDRGVELEIVLVPDDRAEGSWAVIHAMPTAFREGA